ncbi:MAG: hypothetical protein ACM32O_21345 [Clostridia bacterium]
MIRFLEHRSASTVLPFTGVRIGGQPHPSLSVEWIKRDGSHDFWAKIMRDTSSPATLANYLPTIGEAVSLVAAAAWEYQFGCKPNAVHVSKADMCDDEQFLEAELYIRFTLLSSTATHYRGELCLLAQDGRVLAKWGELRGERNGYSGKHPVSPDLVVAGANESYRKKGTHNEEA